MIRKILSRINRFKFALLWILFIGVLPSFLLVVYQVQDFQDVLSRNVPWLINFMKGNPLWVGFISATMLIIFQIVGIAPVKSAVERAIPLNQRGLIAFLNVLERPVQAKLDRFSRYAKLTDGNKSDDAELTSKHLFCEITKPLQQMERILEAIYSYYKATDSDDADFKVVLYFINNGGVVEETPVLYFPKDCKPNTPVPLLKRFDTPIMAAVSTKKPKIISDIDKPPAGIRFARTPDDDRTGSLMCWPVVVQHFNEVRLVVSVFVPDKPGYFSDKNKEIYKFVLEPFMRRLVIEYSLYLIRDKANCQGGENG